MVDVGMTIMVRTRY